MFQHSDHIALFSILHFHFLEMFVIVGIFVVVITTLLPRCCVIKAIKKKNIPKQKEGYLPIKIRGATEKVKKREFGFLRAGHGNYAKSADEEFNNFSERILGTTYFDFFGKINKLKRDYVSHFIQEKPESILVENNALKN